MPLSATSQRCRVNPGPLPIPSRECVVQTMPVIDSDLAYPVVPVIDIDYSLVRYQYLPSTSSKCVHHLSSMSSMAAALGKGSEPG
jgi:hypothetical protein